MYKLRRKILGKEDVPILGEVNDEKTKLSSLREKKKANDLLHEAILMYELLAKNF